MNFEEKITSKLTHSISALIELPPSQDFTELLFNCCIIEDLTSNKNLARVCKALFNKIDSSYIPSAEDRAKYAATYNIIEAHPKSSTIIPITKALEDKIERLIQKAQKQILPKVNSWFMENKKILSSAGISQT